MKKCWFNFGVGFEFFSSSSFSSSCTWKKTKNEQKECCIDGYIRKFGINYVMNIFFSSSKKRETDEKRIYFKQRQCFLEDIFSGSNFYCCWCCCCYPPKLPRFLVWLFQSRHKMAVTFFNIWFTFLNSFIHASCYFIFAQQQQHLKHQQKTQEPKHNVAT